MLMVVVLVGGNLIYESLGMMLLFLGVSFEGFVLDDEMYLNIYCVLCGIEVSEDSFGFDVICEVVLGEGYFLGG